MVVMKKILDTQENIIGAEFWGGRPVSFIGFWGSLPPINVWHRCRKKSKTVREGPRTKTEAESRTPGICRFASSGSQSFSSLVAIQLPFLASLSARYGDWPNKKTSEFVRACLIICSIWRTISACCEAMLLFSCGSFCKS